LTFSKQIFFVRLDCSDAESLPSLNLLQRGLLNDDGFAREFLLLTIRLLKCAVEDPGFANPREVS
jgi:hypothetical protein